MIHDPDLLHAGGFIATADEIVQPFSLPRSQYFRPKDRAPSAPESDDDAEMVPDSEGVVYEELTAPNGLDSTRGIENGKGYEDGSVEDHSVTGAMKEPIKTMAELAAEHAERERRLERGSRRGSGPSKRIVRSSRARRKLDGNESVGEIDVGDDEDLSEPSLTDDLSDPSPPKRRRTVSSKGASKTNARSSSKSTPNPRKKRPRSPDVDGGSNFEHDGSFRAKETPTGRRPRRTTTAVRTGKLGSRTTRTVSDRVLRSRKERV